MQPDPQQNDNVSGCGALVMLAVIVFLIVTVVMAKAT